jgi:hypothetical protein
VGWVTGGSSEASLASALDPYFLLRTRAIKALERLGLILDVNLDEGWNNDEGLLLSASLDCSSGKHSVAQVPIVLSK